MRVPSSPNLFLTRRGAQAWTLSELMIAMALLSMVMTGMIYAHIMGLKMYQISRTKLGADEQGRLTLNQMADEIRAAQRVAVGTGTPSSFVEMADGVSQVGNSILIYRSDYNATNNSNSLIRYFLNSSNQLIRLESNSLSGSDLVASSITNKDVFSAVDVAGNTFTVNDNNLVISVKLQFYEIRYPVVTIGSNQLFEFYQITTQVAPRKF